MSTAGCGLLKTSENTAATTGEEPKSRFPFKTREPENFQCEIVETAGETVRRKRLAKKGLWRRIDFDPGEKNHRALLQTDKTYVIDFARGSYTESTPGVGEQFNELTHELLNIGTRSEFEESGRDANLVRYTVRPAESEGTEIVVHFDETVGLPVKQEFFSLSGGERTLDFAVELINFKTEPDAGAFSIPARFKMVALEELLNTSHL